jgi:AcrR family transcriptional regulator
LRNKCASAVAGFARGRIGLQKQASLNAGEHLEFPVRSRSERRREDTRRRLMKATYEIISQRGLEGLVIQDITEVADVGYGSFYNHFESKDAVVAAVIEASRKYSAEIHERISELASDRAEAFAMSLRMCLHHSRADKTWGWFLLRTVLSGGELRSGIGEDLKRAINACLKEGVFKHDDLDMAHEIVFGLLIFGTMKLVSADVPEDYPDKLVRTALKNLGLADEKINSALEEPLPNLNLMPFLSAA